MKEVLFFEVALRRRRWLAHCSALVASAAAVGGDALACRCRRARVRKILVVGDSLSAEYGISRGTGWVALLEQRLAARRSQAQRGQRQHQRRHHVRRPRAPAVRCCGSTSPTSSMIELGGNDALRGLPLDMTRANLTAMARRSRSGRRQGASSSACSCRRTTAAPTASASRRCSPTSRAARRRRWCRSC